MKKSAESRKPIAVYGLSNTGGVEILGITYGIEDKAHWRYYGGEEGTSVIEYQYGGLEPRAFFRIGELTIYMDECMIV